MLDIRATRNRQPSTTAPRKIHVPPRPADRWNLGLARAARAALFSRAMQIAFPTRDYAGYVFDLDGTLIDSMPAHFEAWTAGLRACGFRGEFSEDYFYSLGGVPTKKIVEMLNARDGTALDPSEVAHRKEEIYLRLLPATPLIEPVVAFARGLVARGKPVAIASGGGHHVVHAALRTHGLVELFPVVITPEDVAHGKPSPEMFLLAAKKMGAPARECLVLEDAELGRQAAVAAGMDYVLVPGARERAAAKNRTGRSAAL
jgi:HAD superfamily hydrolase (TIGR01509 family)